MKYRTKSINFDVDNRTLLNNIKVIIFIKTNKMKYKQMRKNS